MRCRCYTLILIVIICSSVYNFVSAQSRDRNYVMTVEPIEGSTEEPYLYYDFSRITVDYYDDLGRIKSRVKAGGTYSVIDQADF